MGSGEELTHDELLRLYKQADDDVLRCQAELKKLIEEGASRTNRHRGLCVDRIRYAKQLKDLRWRQIQGLA